ncbi:MAG: zinc ribbon domain-containing protein [Ruminococcaceae bacterium]|nr:zinc ribbon domain-containing protein [Oscillospiraceae bacterium]
MYCIKCGVKLADTEKTCPLCGTRVFHPDLTQGEGDALYPSNTYPRTKRATFLPQILLTFASVLPIIIVFLCDWQINRTVTWSGYVMGALVLGYVLIVMPSWFKKPNPVIFVPIDFLVLSAYLLYINYETGGKWFMSFAFPLVVGLGVLITALVTLLRYIKRGKLYIYGGFLISLGAFMLLIEFFVNYTFGLGRFIGWSLYPLATLVMIGGLLIFLAIYRPAKEIMERKFFI